MLAKLDQSRLVLIFAAAGHCLFHILVALFLTIVLALESEWNRPYDALIELGQHSSSLRSLRDNDHSGLIIADGRGEDFLASAKKCFRSDELRRPGSD